MKVMRLVVITCESLFEGEAEVLNHLFERGMSRLHLRKPGVTKEALGRLLTGIKEDYYERMVLHDHFELLDSFPLKGVHLNRRNPAYHSREKVSVSRSCHTLEELRQGLDRYDYVFLSPLFDSLSKAGYRQAFLPEQLQEAREQGWINHKVVALGGITPDRIPLLRTYGFGGAAVLGALWGNFLQDKDEAALMERWEKINSSCSRL